MQIKSFRELRVTATRWSLSCSFLCYQADAGNYCICILLPLLPQAWKNFKELRIRWHAEFNCHLLSRVGIISNSPARTYLWGTLLWILIKLILRHGQIERRQLNSSPPAAYWDSFPSLTFYANDQIVIPDAHATLNLVSTATAEDELSHKTGTVATLKRVLFERRTSSISISN